MLNAPRKHTKKHLFAGSRNRFCRLSLFLSDAPLLTIARLDPAYPSPLKMIARKPEVQGYETLLQGVTHQGTEFCEMLNDQYLIAAKSRLAQVNQALLIVRRSLGSDVQGTGRRRAPFVVHVHVAETFRPLRTSSTSQLRLAT